MSNKDKTQNRASSQQRRQFIKQFAIGAGSITFVRAGTAQAQAADSVPPVISLLLDDDCTPTDLNQIVQIDPQSSSQLQEVCIPKDANAVQIAVYGAGGAGSGTSRSEANQWFYNGSQGGDGGINNATFDLTGIDKLSVYVGEGGKAGESTESGAGGEYGGGSGGAGQMLSGTNDFIAAAGGGGGGSAVFANDNQLLIAAGGGGGGGSSAGTGESTGGAGGFGSSETSEGGTGDDGTGSLGHFGFGGGFDGEAGSNSASGAGMNPVTAEDGSASTQGGEGAPANGGNQNALTSIGSGGAGGGAGGGFHDTSVNPIDAGAFETSSYAMLIGSGGGGAGGSSVEGTFFAGGGGGGAAGSNFQSTEANQPSEPSIDLNMPTATGGDGGEGSFGASATFSPGLDGQSGKVLIRFVKLV